MKIQKLNGNILKIIAVISMTIDHMGLLLFNNNLIMRSIGRLAFPIFGFMIAEGCFYTKNKLSYFLKIFILGVLCQIVYYFSEESLYFGILITFSFSILTIYSYQNAFENDRVEVKNVFLFILMLCVDFLVCVIFPMIFDEVGFMVDYGIFGVLFPLLAYIGRKKKYGIPLMALGLILICFTDSSWYQWFSLLALIFLAIYSGKRGKLGWKYFFYIYYPVHLVVIWLISLIL